MRLASLLSLSAAILIVAPTATRAQVQQTGSGKIVSIQSGSLLGHLGKGELVPVQGDDTLTVQLEASVPVINSSETPATGVPKVPSCTVAIPGCVPQPSPAAVPCEIKGVYALDPADAGVKLNESILLTAYFAGKPVSLSIDGCVFNKSRIVGVQLKN